MAGEVDESSSGSEWESVGQAFRSYQFPAENLPLVQRIMDHVGIERYVGTQSRYFKAIRRDGARPLTVHYGFTSGFETETEAVDAAGDVDRELLGSRWRITHPLNDVGDHHRDDYGAVNGKQTISVCPTCFMQLPASGVCDTCG